MPENALERFLRLSEEGQVVQLASPFASPAAPPAGRQQVQVRPYQRVQQGRPQAVRQHTQGHPVSHQVIPGPGPVPPPQPGLEKAGDLQPGDVIQVGSERYAVTSVKPWAPVQTGPNTAGTTSGKNTGSAGTGINTGGPPSTSSAGTGVNTKGSVDPQLQLDATASALRLPFNGPQVIVGLRQLDTGATFSDFMDTVLPVVVVSHAKVI